MKKLIYLSLIFLALACQEKIVPVKYRYTPVNVGSAPNDGTGDNLRAAFIKVNAGFVDVYDSLGNIYTEAQVVSVVSDTARALLDSAELASDYYWPMADSNTVGNPVTYDYFWDYNGGGSQSDSINAMEFIVDVNSGSITATDTAFTIADLAGKEIFLYRGTTADMPRQYLNRTATNGYTGYRFNASGQVVVRPALAAGDRLLLEGRSTTNVHWLTLSGEESTLLDDIEGVWNLNELSGVTVYDALGVLNGTTDVSTRGYAGKLGYCYYFPGAATEISMGKILEVADTFSISIWVKSTSAETTQEFIINNMAYDGTDWNGYGIDIDEGVVAAYVASGADGLGENTTATGVDDGNWHHIVMTYDSDTIYVYKDGVKGAAVLHSFPPTYIAGNYLYYGNNAYGTAGYDGYLDQVIFWSRPLSDAEVAELYASGAGNNYPF